MRRYFSKVPRIIGFSIIPMLGLLSPLLALPAVTSEYGAAGWGAVAIGQSLGGAAAVVVELGWSLNGPQRTAPQSKFAARRILALSLATKLIASLPIVSVAAVCAIILSPDYRLTAGLTAIGTTLTGLSCVWYYLGRGNIIKILLFDSLPKISFVAVSAGVINIGGPLWTYPTVGLLTPIFVSLLAICISEKIRPRVLHGFTLRRLFTIIGAQKSPVAARSASAIYISLPVAIVSMVAPSAVAQFAAVERLQRMALQILAAVPNMMQKWVGSAVVKGERNQRIKVAILLNGAFGILAGLLYAVTVPYIVDLVFSGVVTISSGIAAMSGVLIFIVCTSRGTGNLGLVALRKVSVITRSAVWGAVVGIGAIFIFSYIWGATGALSAVIGAEIVVLLIQTVAIRRLLKSPRALKVKSTV